MSQSSETPAERSLRARIAAATRWAQEPDRRAATQPARDAMLRRFEDEVDPDRRLSEPERARRVESARKAYYSRLSLAAAQARRAKAAT